MQRGVGGESLYNVHGFGKKGGGCFDFHEIPQTKWYQTCLQTISQPNNEAILQILFARLPRMPHLSQTPPPRAGQRSKLHPIMRANHAYRIVGSPDIVV